MEKTTSGSPFFSPLPSGEGQGEGEGNSLRRINRTDTRSGFTILEICLVLFIVALLAGAAIPLTTGLLQEERLRKPMREIELMARTARHLAVVQHRTYALTINTDTIQLHPWVETDSSSSNQQTTVSTSLPVSPKGTDTQASEEEGEESAQPSSRDPVEYEYTLPTDVKLTVRGWQEKDWYEPADRDWLFPSTGLCEPLEIRVQKGEAFIEHSYNPLTGAIKDEKNYLP